jgi:hypothetical protein
MDFNEFYFKEKENPQIYTDEFKKWFGHSKVVDDKDRKSTRLNSSHNVELR